MTKHYIQPAVLVAHIAMESMVLAGSPAPSGDMEIHNITTDEQW